MYQRIILSPAAFQHLPRKKEQFAIMASLSTERLVSDESRAILRELRACVENAPEEGGHKGLLLSLYQTLIVSPEVLKGVAAAERPEGRWVLLELEKAISRCCDFAPILAESSGPDSGNADEPFEIADTFGYMKPELTSRIRQVGVYQFERNQIFDVVDWLGKYIDDAKQLILMDPYLVVDPIYDQVSRLLQHANKKIPITLETLNDKARSSWKLAANKTGDGVCAEERIQQLIDSLDLKKASHFLHEKGSGLKDRVIQTDKFTISYGHSLGGVEYPSCRVTRQFTITVNRSGGS